LESRRRAALFSQRIIAPATLTNGHAGPKSIRMTRLVPFTAFAALALFVAAPAAAVPSSARDVPSCDGDKKEKEKNPSAAEPACDGDKKEKEKNPSAAEPTCDGDKKDEKKEKNPSLI
jgi:hypothetical protein